MLPRDTLARPLMPVRPRHRSGHLRPGARRAPGERSASRAMQADGRAAEIFRRTRGGGSPPSPATAARPGAPEAPAPSPAGSVPIPLPRVRGSARLVMVLRVPASRRPRPSIRRDAATRACRSGGRASRLHRAALSAAPQSDPATSRPTTPAAQAARRSSGAVPASRCCTGVGASSSGTAHRPWRTIQRPRRGSAVAMVKGMAST